MKIMQNMPNCKSRALYLLCYILTLSRVSTSGQCQLVFSVSQQNRYKLAISFVPRTPFLRGHSRPERKVEPGDEGDGHENERPDNLKGLSLKIVIKKCAKTMR